mgnify:CR=1 FL=1
MESLTASQLLALLKQGDIAKYFDKPSVSLGLESKRNPKQRQATAAAVPDEVTASGQVD